MSAQTYLSDQGFQDPYSFDAGPIKATGSGGIYGPYTDDDWGKNTISSGNSFAEKVGDWLGISDYKGDYERWKIQKDREYERESTNSARAWDLWMDSTKVQRLAKDIEAAGLNPWLALQSGSFSTSNTSTASQGGSARYKSSESSKSNLSGLGMLLLGAAKLIAAIL